MLYKYIEYLKRPELVINVQKYFGILYETVPDNRCFNNDSKYHKRDHSTASEKSQTESDAANDLTVSDNKNTSKISYRVTNSFWYYLFVLGTALGDEIFYATFIPFWFWNIDGAVGRRVVFVWSSVMYVGLYRIFCIWDFKYSNTFCFLGQSLKDIIRFPRPGPPVIRLQKKWALEYGLPSTVFFLFN